MAIHTIRRLASDILGVGENKIRMKPTEIKRIEEALTRDDVTNLIKDGVVYKLPMGGRKKIEKRARRGFGRIRGSSSRNQKIEWMKRIRSQRKYLKELLASGSLDHKFKTSIYRKIKSGTFKTKKTLLIYLKENNMHMEKSK